ncbi:MAG: hypothetical protein JRJ40_11620 [Deltaproteobacteria bacterium]|nr:hypothetical protein [Deltaproteobacteria bacterium]
MYFLYFKCPTTKQMRYPVNTSEATTAMPAYAEVTADRFSVNPEPFNPEPLNPLTVTKTCKEFRHHF